VHLKANQTPAYTSTVPNLKDMPEKNEKQLESMESVYWVER